MFVVVGSGPAGVACAHALLDGGAEVTMVDAGLDLEPERAARVAQLAAMPPSQWTEDSLKPLREGVEVRSGGIPQKLAYGSEYPYREPLPLPMRRGGVEGTPSFARGGLSNVWGASMLPFAADDIAGWPITLQDLDPHYRAVLELIPHSARSDRLAAQFPLRHENPGGLRSSSQATAMLRDLESAHDALRTLGVTFGAARLGLQAASDGRPGCVYCAQCLYGCPYGYIYNSAQTLERLQANKRFAYRPGALVRSVVDSGSGAELRGTLIDGGGEFSMRADRAFVACGVFSTARIVLGSLEAFNTTIRAADNCYFLIPLIRYRGRREVMSEPLHTLAQVFIELQDPAVGPHRSHLQVYTYNDLYRVQLRNMLGPARRLLGGITERALLGRLLLIQGYLHSDLSAGVDITLTDHGTLVLEGSPNPRAARALAALKRRLWSARGAMRALPMTMATRVGAPGRGFHTGGTFPMHAEPGPMRTDVLGRLHGMPHVHLVDASVFPTLPATTITLSVMANAHRIGAAAVA